MSKASRPNRTWILAVAGLVALAIVLLLVSRGPGLRPVDWVIRSAALLGYLSVFAAVVSSAYLREMLRWFGKPYLTVHHYLAIAGLSLLTLHPLGLAVRATSLSVFIPDVSSVRAFLTLGGRPAWYLLVIAALAVIYRKALGSAWRPLHWLTYLAFWLGTIHAILIGPNVQGVPMRILAVAMALVVVYVFVRKRTASGPTRAKPAA